MYDYKAKIIRVVDGDTAIVDINLGFDIVVRQTVRFARINAFETRLGKNTNEEEKKIGLEAKEYVKNLIEGKEVYLKTFKDKGKYGRYIAEIYYGEEKINLNDELVTKKYAIYQSY